MRIYMETKLDALDFEEMLECWHDCIAKFDQVPLTREADNWTMLCIGYVYGRIIDSRDA